MNFKILKDHQYLLKKTARTLNLSFKILPPYIRFMLSYGYLVARAMDSVVDESDADSEVKKDFIYHIMSVSIENASRIPQDLKNDVLKGLNEVERRLVLEIDNIISYFKSSLGENDLKAFRKLIKGIYNGMLIDLYGFKSGSLDDYKTLDRYVSLIGGIPALYWYDVYLNYKPSVFKSNFYKSAYNIGKALQYTNILKDMHDDIERGRCYIPLEYLREKNLSVEDLKNPLNISKVKDFIKSVVIVAIDFLDESERFISSIDNSEFALKLSLIWPIYWSVETLSAVLEKNPLQSKIKISKASVYETLIKSPLLLSSSFFRQGYRFRREMLMLALNS